MQVISSLHIHLVTIAQPLYDGKRPDESWFVMRDDWKTCSLDLFSMPPARRHWSMRCAIFIPESRMPSLYTCFVAFSCKACSLAQAPFFFFAWSDHRPWKLRILPAKAGRVRAPQHSLHHYMQTRQAECTRSNPFPTC